jgi:N-acetylmuramic acid 6-phosphate etherase
MSTESKSPRYAELDLWPTLQAAEAMLEEQQAAVAAVAPALPVLAQAAEAAALRLKAGGRLIYVGAGTSGRIAIQDGVELGPTFDWPEDRLVHAMAGGEIALLHGVENAEDDDAAGAAVGQAAAPLDVVVAVAASGSTPYTVAAVKAAAANGALTIGLANNAGKPLLAAAHFAVLLETGAEVVSGSTRMKAGTAQKAALNILSTAIMLRLGRVYAGLMVSMRPTNRKLRQRAAEMVQSISGCDAPTAQSALDAAHGHIKNAVLIARGLSAEEAAARLAACDDDLRLALGAE